MVYIAPKTDVTKGTKSTSTTAPSTTTTTSSKAAEGTSAWKTKNKVGLPDESKPKEDSSEEKSKAAPTTWAVKNKVGLPDETKPKTSSSPSSEAKGPSSWAVKNKVGLPDESKPKTSSSPSSEAKGPSSWAVKNKVGLPDESKPKEESSEEKSKAAPSTWSVKNKVGLPEEKPKAIEATKIAWNASNLKKKDELVVAVEEVAKPLDSGDEWLNKAKKEDVRRRSSAGTTLPSPLVQEALKNSVETKTVIESNPTPSETSFAEVQRRFSAVKIPTEKRTSVTDKSEPLAHMELERPNPPSTRRKSTESVTPKGADAWKASEISSDPKEEATPNMTEVTPERRDSKGLWNKKRTSLTPGEEASPKIDSADAWLENTRRQSKTGFTVPSSLSSLVPKEEE